MQTIVCDMQSIDSDCFSRIGYVPESRTLYLEFRDKQRLYAYTGVPRAVWNGLLNAPSRGVFYREDIQGEYAEQALDSQNIQFVSPAQAAAQAAVPAVDAEAMTAAAEALVAEMVATRTEIDREIEALLTNVTNAVTALRQGLDARYARIGEKAQALARVGLAGVTAGATGSVAAPAAPQAVTQGVAQPTAPAAASPAAPAATPSAPLPPQATAFPRGMKVDFGWYTTNIKTVYARLGDNTTYRFLDVPVEVGNAYTNASDKTAYCEQHLVGQYRVERA